MEKMQLQNYHAHYGPAQAGAVSTCASCGATRT